MFRLSHKPRGLKDNQNVSGEKISDYRSLRQDGQKVGSFFRHTLSDCLASLSDLGQSDCLSVNGQYVRRDRAFHERLISVHVKSCETINRNTIRIKALLMIQQHIQNSTKPVRKSQWAVLIESVRSLMMGEHKINQNLT
jgi:hypothetical protein